VSMIAKVDLAGRSIRIEARGHGPCVRCPRLYMATKRLEVGMLSSEALESMAPATESMTVLWR
jgi:hypothetical protein